MVCLITDEMSPCQKKQRERINKMCRDMMRDMTMKESDAVNSVSNYKDKEELPQVAQENTEISFTCKNY